MKRKFINLVLVSPLSIVSLAAIPFVFRTLGYEVLSRVNAGEKLMVHAPECGGLEVVGKKGSRVWVAPDEKITLRVVGTDLDGYPKDVRIYAAVGGRKSSYYAAVERGADGVCRATNIAQVRGGTVQKGVYTVTTTFSALRAITPNMKPDSTILLMGWVGNVGNSGSFCSSNPFVAYGDKGGLQGSCGDQNSDCVPDRCGDCNLGVNNCQVELIDPPPRVGSESLEVDTDADELKGDVSGADSSTTPLTTHRDEEEKVSQESKESVERETSREVKRNEDKEDGRVNVLSTLEIWRKVKKVVNDLVKLFVKGLVFVGLGIALLLLVRFIVNYIRKRQEELYLTVDSSEVSCGLLEP